MSRRAKKQLNLREIGIIIFLILFAGWLSLLVVSIFHKQQLARLTVQETRNELESLAKRSTTLSASVQEFNTDRGQEASFRETFGVAKPGEEVIIVVPKKELAPPPQPNVWDNIKAFFDF